MSAAVGLAVEANDVDDTNLLHPIRDEVHLRPDQVWIPERLLASHVENLGGIALDQFLIETPLHLEAKLNRHSVQLKVHPCLARLHIPSGDLGAEVSEDHSRKGVQGGMGLHRQVPAIPIDCPLNRSPRIGENRIIGNHMQGPPLAPNGVNNLYLTAVPFEDPYVARLAAAPRIEHCPVQIDASVSHLGDVRFGGRQVGVLAG